MLLILSIIISLILILAFRKQIKRHAVALYIITTILSIIMIVLKLNKNIEIPQMLNNIIIRPLTRAAFSTALFTIVMYIGALDKKNPIVKKLFTVRGEISIIACISTLGHNIAYGWFIFPNLFTDPSSMPVPRLIAAIVSVILILIMIPLMVTSFISVRKRMKSATWKKIQRSAYVFYMLIYVHIMCLFIPKIQKTKVDVIVYSIIFLGYAVLRIKKYLKDKNA